MDKIIEIGKSIATDKTANQPFLQRKADWLLRFFGNK